MTDNSKSDFKFGLILLTICAVIYFILSMMQKVQGIGIGQNVVTTQNTDFPFIERAIEKPNN